MASRKLLSVMATGVLVASAVACGVNQGTGPTGGSARPTAAGSTAGSAPPTAAAKATMPAGIPTRLSDPACGEVPGAAAGKWSMTLTPRDLPPELFDADTGVFVMTLGPGHHVRTDVDSDHRGDDEDMCWTAMQVAYVSDRQDCDRDSLGVYDWVLDGNTLTFKALRDDCFWRPFMMTFNVWTRVPA